MFLWVFYVEKPESFLAIQLNYYEADFYRRGQVVGDSVALFLKGVWHTILLNTGRDAETIIGKHVYYHSFLCFSKLLLYMQTLFVTLAIRRRFKR